MTTTGNAFLLAQLGAHAAARFAERITELDLTPPQTGLLRAIATDPGRSQQALAGQLSIPPSRLVVLVDELERRGLIERRRNPDDRRLHAVHLTAAGGELLGRIREVATAHEDTILWALDESEREQLFALLSRVAQEQGLAPGVHPGYRSLGKPKDPADR
ncbi:MAG TPA: MarR family winged helix-turn-helix transcriptional regulator [Pseudonocardiaceae bacterium]|nr:MarR family winged helix-turn-helix transcriptional regulator [Pseudonocardiaceae bacterium]